MGLKYRDYIDSAEWHKKSENFLKKYPICIICHKHNSTTVHHNSYENLGEELESELFALCERCHMHLHDLPPFIDDKDQFEKAVKLLEDFKLPRLKTLILNKVGDKYFDGAYMVDYVSEHTKCFNTAFFPQNMLEFFYSRDKEIINYASQQSYLFKMKAGSNKYKKVVDHKRRREEFLKKNAQPTQTSTTTSTTTIKPVEFTEDEKIMKNKILKYLNNYENLRNAKSYINIKYFNGTIYFNQIGVKSAADLLVYIIKKDKLEEFYNDLENILLKGE